MNSAIAHLLQRDSTDILNLLRAVFVGHDWGGSIVYRMAMYHPNRVLGVASFCTPYDPPRSKFVDINECVARLPSFSYVKFLADTEVSSKHLKAAPRQLFTAVYRAPHKKPDTSSRITFLDVILGIGHSSHPLYERRSNILGEDELAFYVRAYAAIDFEDERELPRVIPHPVLYVGAGWDPVLTPELAVHMPRVVPNLEVVVIETASH